MRSYGGSGGLILVAVLAGASSLVAPAGEDAKRMVGQTWRYPLYDDQGRLKMQMLGDTATTLPGGDIEVTNFRMELFNSGTNEVKIATPKCVYGVKTGSVKSDADVRVERAGVVITGRGFEWLGKGNEVKIFHDVRVELRNMSELAKHEAAPNR